MRQNNNDNEVNILKAFELGAFDLLNQKRNEKDFIDFSGAANPASKPSNSIDAVGKEQLIIGFEDDDDEEEEEYKDNIHQQKNNYQITQSKNNQSDVNDIQRVKDQAIGLSSYSQQQKIKTQEDKGDVDEPTHIIEIDKQLFIDRSELQEEGQENQKNSKNQAAKPAGIYLEKDEDLEKLKQEYEGQKKMQQDVDEMNKNFAASRIAQEKKKKQQQNMKQQKKESEVQVQKLTKQDFKYDKTNKLKNIIHDEEELGEVGEWIEKTANKNKKSKKTQNIDHNQGEDDSEEEQDKDNQSKEDNDSDFDFDIPNPKKPEINSENNTSGKQTNGINNLIIEEEDEEENHFPSGKMDTKSTKQEKNDMIKQKQDLVNKKLQQKQILQHKNGPIANRLQDKAKFIELTNNQEKGQNVNSEKAINNVIKDQNINNENKLEQQDKEKEESEEEINWDAVNRKAVAEYKQHAKKGQGSIKQISFIDAWGQLKSRNLSELKCLIVTDNRGEGGSISCIERLMDMCGLDKARISSAELLNERDQIFAIAKMGFDDNDDLHFSILSSIYSNFKDNFNCPRIGSHWETIGFQGLNPATDMRGGGVLSILQILAYLSHYKAFMQEVLEYSADSIHHFPLCITLINITAMVLQTARENKLNSLINNEKSVISVFNNFYFATFYLLFTEYKQQKMTFNLLGNHLNSISMRVKLNPTKTIQEFKQNIQLYYKHKEN